MTEQITNPYAVDQFDSGGGLWDEKVVQITGASFVMGLMTKGDGSPVISDYGETKGKQAINRALHITGISAEEDKERWQDYSIGAFEPTAGGEQCAHPTDPSKRLHENTGTAKFFKGLDNAGFDVATLYPRISALVGQRFLFRAVAVLDKDGKQIVKKGFAKKNYFPVALAEGSAPALAAVATQSGPAAITGGGALAKKADEVILAVLLKAKDNKLTRTGLVKEVSKALAEEGVVSSADANQIVALVVRQDFHEGKAWTYSGTGISL